MQNVSHFDYLIIGTGLAGFQLALALSKDPFFKNHKIGLIEPSQKTKNDKTWSFWEVGEGKFDSIVEKEWHTVGFKSRNVSLNLALDNYRYKTIRAIDFYKWAKQQLASTSNFKFITDTVERIEATTRPKVIGENGHYTAKHVFDSRIPKAFYKRHTYTLIHQHFKGWVIETPMACFDPNIYTMMDYRYRYQNSTNFIYVLPFSKTKALIECTFFTPQLVAPHVYEDLFKTYLKTQLKLEEYRVLETEVGNIPMTDFPFWKFHKENITKIGTAGGWVKASTGYAFKHTQKKVSKIIGNIKQNHPPPKGLYSKKFRFYDKIFLKVLHDDNEKGEWIFERFYSKNTVRTMFRFLDEESSFREDVRIMKSLFSWAFIRAFFKILFRF